MRNHIEISDPVVIKAICDMQTGFVKRWNAAEMNDGINQTHDLPAGATYSGGVEFRGAWFLLPEGASVRIYAKAPWQHWGKGWSSCRNTLCPDQVRKVVVYGSEFFFYKWFEAAMVELT